MVSVPSLATGLSEEVGVAFASGIPACSFCAYALLISVSSGILTNAGSPSVLFRSTKARWNAEASRCSASALFHGAASCHRSRMFSVSITVIPPDDDGGIAMIRRPR